MFFTIEYELEEKFDTVSKTINMFVKTLNFIRLIFDIKTANEISWKFNFEKQESREKYLVGNSGTLILL